MDPESFFRGGPVLLRNPIFCDFPGGGGVRTPFPPLDPRMPNATGYKYMKVNG